MSRTSQALFSMETRTEQEFGGQLNCDQSQFVGLGGQLFVVDIGGVAVDDLAHKLEVLLGVLISVVKKANVLLLNALFDGAWNFDFLAVVA